MRNIIVLILFLYCGCAQADMLKIAVTDPQQAKMKLMIGVVNRTQQLDTIATLMKDD